MMTTAFPSITAPAPVTALQWVGVDCLVVAGTGSMGVYDGAGNLLASIPEGARRLAWHPGDAFVRYLKAHPKPVECSAPCDWAWATQILRPADPGVYYSCCCAYDRVGNFVHGGELYDWGYWMGRDQQEDRIVGATHIPVLQDLAFSPDGAWLLTGGRDSHLAVWAFPQQHPSQKSRGDKIYQPDGSIVHAVAWSDSGSYIAAGLSTGRVEVWELASAQRIANINVERRWYNIRKIRFVPGDEELIIVGTYEAIKLNQLWRNRAINVLEGWCAFDLSPSGKHIALGSTDGQVWVRDLSEYLGRAAVK